MKYKIYKRKDKIYFYIKDVLHEGIVEKVFKMESESIVYKVMYKDHNYSTMFRASMSSRYITSSSILDDESKEIINSFDDIL